MPPTAQQPQRYTYDRVPPGIVQLGHQLAHFRAANPGSIRQPELKDALEDFLKAHPTDPADAESYIAVSSDWLTHVFKRNNCINEFVEKVKLFRDPIAGDSSRTTTADSQVTRNTDRNPFPYQYRREERAEGSRPHRRHNSRAQSAPNQDNNGPEMTDFTDAQIRRISDMIAQSVNAAIANNPNLQGARGQDGPPGPPGPAGPEQNNGYFRPQEIGFFYPDLPEKDGKGDVVQSGADTFIRNVHIFIDRIHDTTLIRGENTVKSNLSLCFRGSAATWYSSALTDLEKIALRTEGVPLSHFTDLLKKQFAQTISVALAQLTSSKYTLEDARNQRSITAYVLDTVRHGKDANIGGLHNQLTFAWEGIHALLRQGLTAPNEATQLHNWCRQLEDQRDTWRQVADTYSQLTRNVGSAPNRGQYASSRLGRRNFASSPQTRFEPRSSGYNPGFSGRNSHFQNPARPQAYQQQPRRDDISRLPLPHPRQPLLLENAQNWQQRQGIQPGSRFSGQPQSRHPGRGGYQERPIGANFQDPDPIDAYYGLDNQENTYMGYDDHVHPDQECSVDDGPGAYTASPNLQHFEDGHPLIDTNLQNPEASADNNFVDIFHAEPKAPPPRRYNCRNCEMTFSTRNQLFRHLDACPKKKEKRSGQAPVETNGGHNSGKKLPPLNLLSTSDPNPTSKATTPTSKSSILKLKEKSIGEHLIPHQMGPVVQSKATQALGSGYAFQGYQYATCLAALDPKAKCESIVLDSGNTMSISSRRFLTRQSGGVDNIKWTKTPIGVKGVGPQPTSTQEYALVNLFIPGKRPDGAAAVAHLKLEVHVIDDLGPNLLLGSDVMSPHKMDILYSRQIAQIGMCENLEVPIQVFSRDNQKVRRIVKSQQDITIDAFQTQAVPIYAKKKTLPDRHFLFVPDDRFRSPEHFGPGGGPEAHLIDTKFDFIMVANNKSQPVTIQRSFKLGHIEEYDAQGAFQVSPVFHGLAAAAVPEFRLTRELLEDQQAAEDFIFRASRAPNEATSSYSAGAAAPNEHIQRHSRGAPINCHDRGTLPHYAKNPRLNPDNLGLQEASSYGNELIHRPSNHVAKLLGRPERAADPAKNPQDPTQGQEKLRTPRAATRVSPTPVAAFTPSQLARTIQGTRKSPLQFHVQNQGFQVPNPEANDKASMPRITEVQEGSIAQQHKGGPQLSLKSDQPQPLKEFDPRDLGIFQDDDASSNPRRAKPSLRAPISAQGLAERTEVKGIFGETLFGSEREREAYILLLSRVPLLFQDSGRFVDLPEERWMPVTLTSDWRTSGAKLAHKPYPLGEKERAIVDRDFGRLHDQDKMAWSTDPTPFAFPVFVVWRAIYGPDGIEYKGRSVVDIRGLNRATIADAYPMPDQRDIIKLLRSCYYITILDARTSFYMFRVRREDRHKFTVVSHRGLEHFLVPVMGFKGSPPYVQRISDEIFRDFRGFMRPYMDDYVIASPTFESHLEHLAMVLERLDNYGFTLNPAKCHIGYPSIQLLGQKVDALGLATAEDKLVAIRKIKLPQTLKDLERYLGLTGYLRQYVPYFSQLKDALEQEKTRLLKDAPKSGHARSSFASNKRIIPTPEIIASFNAVQEQFQNETMLFHHDPSRPVYIDPDASKERGFGTCCYHVQGDPQETSDIKRNKIQPILFLSKVLSPAERRYWPTELEVAGIVWSVRKLRHIIQSSRAPVIIFSDHSATVGIAKSTSLTSSSTDKLNPRLIRAAQYLSLFEIEIRYWPGRLHVIPDALSRLPTQDDSAPNDDTLEEIYTFNVLTVELDKKFKDTLINSYHADKYWSRISALVGNADSPRPGVPFKLRNKLLHYVNPTDGRERLCIPKALEGDIFRIHHDERDHAGIFRAYQSISAGFFIRHLSRRLRIYIAHCMVCQLNRTLRHKPFGELQPIQTPPIPFHTMCFDIVTGLPEVQGFNAMMSMTCHCSKAAKLFPGRDDYTSEQWAEVTYIGFLEWGIPKASISDRDPKFMSEIFRGIFRRQGTFMMVTTAYHPQSDGQSERTNQTAELAIRFKAAMGNIDWVTALPEIAARLNNAPNATTGKAPNEILYGFKVNQGGLDRPMEDLLADAEMANLPPLCAFEMRRKEIRQEAADAVVSASTTTKIRYDSKHQPLQLKPGDEVFIRLHQGYNIPGISRKLGQQRAGPFQITRVVSPLAYELDLPPTMKIHPVLSIAHLEPRTPGPDPYNRSYPDLQRPDAVVEDRYLVEKILDKKVRRIGRSRNMYTFYRVKWMGWGPEHNQWVRAEDIDDDLIKDYEASRPNDRIHRPDRTHPLP